MYINFEIAFSDRHIKIELSRKLRIDWDYDGVNFYPNELFDYDSHYSWVRTAYFEEKTPF